MDRQRELNDVTLSVRVEPDHLPMRGKPRLCPEMILVNLWILPCRNQQERESLKWCSYSGSVDSPSAGSPVLGRRRFGAAIAVPYGHENRHIIHTAP